MFHKDMPYRRLGNAGIKLSAISLGGWTTYGASVKAEDTVRGIIRAAYEAGVNFFDISDIYEKGEAERILKVKQAEAEAQSKALQGKGIADQRRAIVEGLKYASPQYEYAQVDYGAGYGVLWTAFDGAGVPRFAEINGQWWPLNSAA